MEHILVTRSGFCKKCWQRGAPRKHDTFIVFGGSAQQFKIKTAHVHGISGFTPHLYTIQFPYLKTKDHLILATKTCLMDGCGILIGKLRDDGKFGLEFKEAEEITISPLAADALITLWRNTGYELL